MIIHSDERIKPEDLHVGDHFRLTGDAENEAERNDKNVYEVAGTKKKFAMIDQPDKKGDRKCWVCDGTAGKPPLVFMTRCDVLVRVVGAESKAVSEMGIAAWVPLIRIGHRVVKTERSTYEVEEADEEPEEG